MTKRDKKELVDGYSQFYLHVHDAINYNKYIILAILLKKNKRPKMAQNSKT